MSTGQPPRLMAVFPFLTSEVAALLRADHDSDALAAAVEELRYHGQCRCGPTCLMTAPAGTPTPYVLELERDDEPVVCLSLDSTATTVTHIEVLDGRDLS